MADPRMVKCAALACNRQISRKKLLCMSHWGIVPTALQKELLAHYKIGQDVTGRISPEYRIAVSEVVKFIAFREGVLVKEVSDEPDDRDDGRGGEDDYSNGD